MLPVICWAFLQVGLIVLGARLYFYLKDQLAPCGGVGELEKAEGEQRLEAPHTIQISLLLWAGVMLPINCFAFWVPTSDWGPDDRRSQTSHFYLAVLLAGTCQMFLPLLVFCWAWIVRLQTTRAGAEHAYAGMRYALLDGVLLPPVYALYIAYRLGTERWYLPLAAYASQAAVWLAFFCRLQREALARAVAAGTSGLAPV
ncbi:hypothetical protein AURDEDRAFT_116176 [Auricularia subglabra TFB-10046 SS5]|nr:hypothetical protein AURDEDRAFT_116176 [Auricularia subglabra TFB-10046 SS5]